MTKPRTNPTKPKFLRFNHGDVFGRLTVIRKLPSKNNTSLWECLCQCGGKAKVSGSGLNSGSTKSCGCLRRESTSQRRGTHRKSQTSEFRVWASMLERCSAKHGHAFKYYGSRGIKVCKRWRDSFQSFYDDMGLRPSRLYSIERIDNDGGYSPKNCRWATKSEQSRNTRTTCRVMVNGKSVSAASLHAEEKRPITYSGFLQRLRRGWSVPKALAIPARKTVKRIAVEYGEAG